MKKVAIVGGTRTPFVKAGGVLASYSSLDLSKHVVTAALNKLQLDPSLIDELFFGTVLLDPRVPNLAREIVLRTGLPKSISGHFVSNNCITGLVAAALAKDSIESGRIQCALAGGVESMSQPTLTFPARGEKFFLKLNRARKLSTKLSLLATFRPSMVAPVPPSPKGPSTGLTMGQHCEIMAQEFSASRAEQDKIAFLSHQKAFKAQSSGVLAKQITPIGGVEADNLIRADSSLEKLATLPAVFDRSSKGTISAGNSSALTDGASVVCLSGEEFARRENLTILGYVKNVSFASVPPGDGLLMAPAVAVPQLLERERLSLEDIDVFEIHEAFGAQVLCNLQAWKEGWKRGFNETTRRKFGEIPEEKMNIFGGSIALGHPFAATGGRLLLNACQALEATGGKRALISVCAAGGGAAAALVTRD